MLTFFAEITFWEEFKTRFNFIAVDYLIYTHEVVSNIQESYPLPLLVLGVTVVTFLVLFLFNKRKSFTITFATKATWKERVLLLLVVAGIGLTFAMGITNNQAEWSSNRYNSEISKSGIYSFFAAFRNNQMKYDEFILR